MAALEGRGQGRGRAAWEVGPFPSTTTKSLVLGVARGAPALSPPTSAQTHLLGSQRLAAPPPPTSQALSCISCKYRHFLPWEGLAVLGPHPASLPHNAWATPHPRPSLGPREMPPFAKSWPIQCCHDKGGQSQVWAGGEVCLGLHSKSAAECRVTPH